jgi:hypothetical protein
LFGRREPDVLAKILPFGPDVRVDFDSFSSFDKRVMIVRDPRDQLISRLLYGPVLHTDLHSRDDALSGLIELLKRKEADPRSVSVKSILETLTDSGGKNFSGWAERYHDSYVRAPLDFHDEHGELFTFLYEEMVDEKFGGLEGYLGLRLRGEARVEAVYHRVVRTKGYGNWRDWFTEEDCAFLRPVLRPFLERYYPEADWELRERPTILAEHASGYVLRIANERRGWDGLPAFEPEGG